MSLLEKASLIVTPNAYKTSKLYSVVPNTTLGDMDVVRATTATRVNSAGLIESVGLNIPRIDYTNGTCPSLLVEPQRTNLLTYSEQFDNASWNKLACSVTLNSIISPNNTLTADSLIESNTNSRHMLFRSFVSVIGQSYTLSLFCKKNTRRYVNLNLKNSTGASPRFSAIFDLETGLNLSTSSFGSPTGTSFSIIDFNNGWYKVSITMNSTSVSTNYEISTSNSPTPILSEGSPSYLGDGTSGIYLWGAELEAGSYATSYVPTVATSVTRNADVISKTGISSLIGQTEGTIFSEINFTASNLSDRTIINLSDNTNNNWIFIRTSATISNGIRFRIANDGSLQFDYNSPAISTGLHKVCLSYKLNNINVFIDGVKINNSITSTIPITSKLNIGSMHDNSLQFNDRIKSALLFQTALTDQECIALTTL